MSLWCLQWIAFNYLILVFELPFENLAEKVCDLSNDALNFFSNCLYKCYTQLKPGFRNIVKAHQTHESVNDVISFYRLMNWECLMIFSLLNR